MPADKKADNTIQCLHCKHWKYISNLDITYCLHSSIPKETTLFAAREDYNLCGKAAKYFDADNASRISKKAEEMLRSTKV